MFYEEAREDGGRWATGPASTAREVFDAAWEAAKYVNNSNARVTALEEAYDRRIDAVFRATGIRLDNPLRQPGHVGESEIGLEEVTLDDHMAVFDARLAELVRQHPDKAEAIGAGRPPRLDAIDRARKAETAAADAYERFDGPPLTGGLSAFGGAFAGGLRDPVNLVALGAGPWGRAGQGAKGLAWMAIKQGAANAGVETAVQPAIADWRREAGLGYTASTFALNVGTAFAFGFGADLGIRGGYRAVQSARGLVPVVDRDGGVRAWRPPDEALEEAARASQNDLVRRARSGETAALKQLAEESGASSDPAVRAAFEAIDDIEATPVPLARGVHPEERADFETQGLRALDDPREPFPVEPLPVRRAAGPNLSDLEAAPVALGEKAEIAGKPVARETADGAGDARAVVFELGDGTRETFGAPGAEAWVLREADGWTEAAARTVAARKALAEGQGNVVQAARLIRENPGALDSSVPLDTFEMREARAIARLSEAAFEDVAAGASDARWAGLVGALVPDAERHAAILATLTHARPRDAMDARHMIGALMADGPPAQPHKAGIDDPFGAEAQAQVAALERTYADEIANARKLDRAPRAGDDIAGVSLASNLAEADGLETMRVVMELCKL